MYFVCLYPQIIVFVYVVNHGAAMKRNGKNAIIGGHAIPIGFDNQSFYKALKEDSRKPNNSNKL